MHSLKRAGCSWKTFSGYALPSVAAMLLFSLYTVVDGIFVARGAGETALTAVNIALPFVNTLSGVSILIAMGTATLVAFARGRGDHKEANGLFSQTVFAMTAISLFITVTVAIFARPLAAMLGAGHSTINDTTDYLRIVSIFSVFFILSYCMEVMVKVDDRPHMAVVGVGASFITNIILDYFFVIVFRWGVAGAAWATGIAQVVSLAIFLAYFFGKRSNLKIGRFEPRPRAFLRIFPLGVADCSVEMIIAFLTLLYNKILFQVFGESSQTVYAVVAYLNLFVFMIMQGVAQGMMHLVSLYIGKGKKLSAEGYFRMCLITSLVLSFIFVLICQLTPQSIALLLLDKDNALMGETVRALRQFSLSFPLVGINIAIAGYLTARELPVPSIALALSRGFVFAPISLLLCAYLGGGQLIWMSAFFGEAVCLLVSLVVLYRSRSRWPALGAKADPTETEIEPAS